MAIPVQFQQFKSAGIYRLVYDKSAVLNQDSSVLRLVVGYSPKGPFNTPVFVKSVSDFKTIFGNISKSLEKKGCFFHRTCIHALEAGPILCLNLKNFDAEETSVARFSNAVDNTGKIDVKSMYDTSRFWKLEPANINDESAYVSIAAIGDEESTNTIFVRKAQAGDVAQYNVTVADWYKLIDTEIPDYLIGHESTLVSEYFVELCVFKGKIDAARIAATPALAKYFTVTGEAGSEVVKLNATITDAFGEEIDALKSLYNNPDSGALSRYVASLIPGFMDPYVGYKALDVLFNSESDIHNLMLSLNEDLLFPADSDSSDDINLLKSNCMLTATELSPICISGYTYKGNKFADGEKTKYEKKVDWINSKLNVIINEKGLRDALLTPSDIDFRYIVDSFETCVPLYDARTNIMPELKSQLSYLAKCKELCFAILNFPSVKSMCEYPAQTGNSGNIKFTTDKGSFDINSVVNYVSLPSEENGASFCGFYTPVKFSDGYVDTIAPSAGLVSNAYISKIYNRAVYNVVAGPNYGKINYSKLVGPDYYYSQEELHVIEPFGINCLVYRPTFGTFINANQTAKQLPKTALSSINVRELVIHLQDEIGKVLQSYQWEFNNANTRAAIKSSADLICELAVQNGGIINYVNIIDESNNDADIIDNEMCVISTHIEPGRGMGKMIHELTIYRTGGMSALVKE